MAVYRMRHSRVEVYETVIDSLFRGTGDVAVENRRLRRQISNAADREAPRSAWPGNGQLVLSKSNRDGGELRVGRYRNRGYVTNIARHAEWVHEGVKGRIHPRGSAMAVPRFKGGAPRRAGGKTFPVGPKHKLKSVRGQKANRFLDRAARKVLLRYGAR